ncbi:unnamed protein product [Schistosoma curassoni]|uniref:Ovule protein n=1 Tax=Schistosoma curassoni TaxID=6186 RepID=A0A183JJS7_9TREM|nr:unnamed protein product [Schistosoma curassoni]
MISSTRKGKTEHSVENNLHFLQKLFEPKPMFEDPRLLLLVPLLNISCIGQLPQPKVIKVKTTLCKRYIA